MRDPIYRDLLEHENLQEILEAKAAQIDSDVQDELEFDYSRLLLLWDAMTGDYDFPYHLDNLLKAFPEDEICKEIESDMLRIVGEPAHSDPNYRMDNFIQLFDESETILNQVDKFIQSHKNHDSAKEILGILEHLCRDRYETTV